MNNRSVKLDRVHTLKQLCEKISPEIVAESMVVVDDELHTGEEYVIDEACVNSSDIKSVVNASKDLQALISAIVARCEKEDLVLVYRKSDEFVVKYSPWLMVRSEKGKVFVIISLLTEKCYRNYTRFGICVNKYLHDIGEKLPDMWGNV